MAHFFLKKSLFKSSTVGGTWNEVKPQLVWGDISAEHPTWFLSQAHMPLHAFLKASAESQWVLFNLLWQGMQLREVVVAKCESFTTPAMI